MSKHICRYRMYVHRSSDIEGVFIMSDDELKLVEEINGYNVRYGEVAGKHSEVYYELYRKDIEIISSDKSDIAVFERLFPGGIGFYFKSRWFDTERVYHEGYDAWYRGCSNVEDMLRDEYTQYNNGVFRDVFIEGYNEALEYNTKKPESQV